MKRAFITEDCLRSSIQLTSIPKVGDVIVVNGYRALVKDVITNVSTFGILEFKVKIEYLDLDSSFKINMSV